LQLSRGQTATRFWSVMTRRSSPSPTIRTPRPEALPDWGRGYALDSRPSPPDYAGMSLAAADLAQNLTQPVPIKDGSVLRTVAEANNDVLALPRA
jgi:hypothetical protein